MDARVTLADVRAAAVLLSDVVEPTPVQRSRAIEALVGGRVWLKCEHLQRAGSFKLRGAFTRISRMSDAERRRGVVAASVGNHAQGVALAAEMTGTDAVVFMPRDAPIPKLAATRAYGATIRLVDGDVTTCLERATALADEEGRALVHPFDHPDVIAGQGTIALELLEQVPDAATLVVPAGGGGLLSGIAVTAKAARPRLRVVGVQATGASTFGPSLAAGTPTAAASLDTIADGIAVRRPGELTLAHVAELVDDVVTVDDDATARAVVLLLERAKQLVEPSGAVGVAALLTGAIRPASPTVVVLSGGNIDPLVLRSLITAGLAGEGRYLTLTTSVADRPGALAALLDRVADLRANVVSIEHHRLRATKRLGAVEVVLELETRGSGHAERLVDELRSDGYPVRLD